ncbi:putative tetratricopeptide-like helical domain-containing protein [Lupinus albus]|uniref:Putative tetratricopeptide-like helical domain-containing protein n=1 Tax=Lupinus albus TaxID=3870 RepID=A0A6A4P7U9_LUPAL|nr:putative tetratricopeptide-like helical domain-containing protein [Lupinus albus]
MENPDLVSWNSMIVGYFENGDEKKALNLFVQLQKLCFPKPDEYTFAGIISATGSFSSFYWGRPLHAQVIKTGLERSVFVGSTLVSMYLKIKKLKAAQRVFYSIPGKDVVIWTEMITDASLKMFHEAYEIDDYVLSAVLSACADLAMLRQGEIIHCYVVKLGYDIEMSVSGSLIDMYAKTAPLKLHICRHGMAEEALKLFQEILEKGLVPNEVTFLSLLSACTHSRLVEQGKFIWNYMNIIGLVPGPKHYSCMVTLLSRAALLEEARRTYH